jgi:hypothetical protein
MKSVFVFPPLRKHQAGQHDQETHGSWATGNFTSAGKDGSYDVYDHPSGSKIYFQTNPAILDTTTEDIRIRREEAIGYVDDLLTKYPLSDVTFVFGNGVDEKYRASGVTLPYFGEQGKESWGFPLDSEKPNSPEIIDSWISTNVPNISREKIKGALVVFQPEMFGRKKTGTPKTFGEVAEEHFMAFSNSDSHVGWNENGLKTIITHEYGHLLDQRTYEKSVSDFGSFSLESTSDYGRKNSRELFAETFTAWELERDNPKYQAGFEIFNFDNLSSLVKSISGFHIQESLDPNFSYVLIEFGGMQKHQAGNHDQESHGSWAVGSDGMDTDYRMSHRPPDPEDGAPAHDLTGGGAIYPENVYDKDGARIYAGGEPEMARRVHSIITSMRGNPNAKVQIYRAVPKGTRQVNVGDWVTIDREYAEVHGQSNLNNDYDILSNTVNADEIYTDGNSLYEWSYHPRVQKHQAGQHDQTTHGSWATANGYKLASKDDLPSLDSANYDSTVRNARDNYVGFGYTWMNAYLRDGYIEDTVKIIMSDEISKDEAIGQIESLKSALYETQTTQDLTVTRWTRTGESIIGEKFSETSDFESLIGKTYHAKGFTSTSAKPHESVNDSYKAQSKVLANIHMPAGTYGATVGNDRESEFILAPDTFFVVMGVNDIGEGRISLDLLVTGQGNG